MTNIVLLIQENKFLWQIYQATSNLFKFIPFYLWEEYLIDGLGPSLGPEFKNLTARVLSPAEAGALAGHPETRYTRASLLSKMAYGNQCMALLLEGEIIAYSWFHLRLCEYQNFRLPLNSNEAYLCDVRTFQKYRGKNLAPYLRFQLYRELANQGRTKFYSISLSGNKASAKFNAKLGAKPLRLFLYIELFKKYRMLLPVKKFK